MPPTTRSGATSRGQMGVGLPADGDGDTDVDVSDYGIWKQHFGETILGSGAGAASVAVPEAPTDLLVLCGLISALTMTRRCSGLRGENQAGCGIGGCSTLVMLCVAATACAEQQVTLQTGATLVGNVSIEGAELVVDVDGAKLRVPLKEVATVTSASTDASNQAQRLLFKGLEAQLLSGGEEQEVGLLAEAHRLAPDDPHVAYWYARSLANAGFGKGANQVFQPRRAAIEAAYPGIADRLAKQIEERLAVESLPAALVKRLDQIAAAGDRAGAVVAEKNAYATYFQLVDQTNEPIDRSAFQIQCSGENEKLESFPEGYYLFTFFRRPSFGDDACRLEVSQPGLVSKTFEFQGTVNGVENAGVLRVKRLTEAERRSVVVNVVDEEGKPLAGAKVAFSTRGRFSGQEGVSPVTTSADGQAELSLFPNTYNCQISLEGFSPVNESVTAATDAKQPLKVKVKLYRAITATIKVVWRARLAFNPGEPGRGDAVTTGEFEQHIGTESDNGFRGGPYGPPWVRLMQNGKVVQLQFMEQMYFPQPSSDATWVGRMKVDGVNILESATNAAAAAARFEKIDLSKLDEIKDQLKLPRFNLGGMPGRTSPVTLPVEADAIYVGKINSRDPQTGRPAQLEFKILVTELSTP